MLQASARAIMPASCTPGEEAWISLIGSPGNMQVSGFKGREPVSEEVAAHEQSALLTGSLYLRVIQLAEAVWRRVSLRQTCFCDIR
jgi:hypothetical protein